MNTSFFAAAAPPAPVAPPAAPAAAPPATQAAAPPAATSPAEERIKHLFRLSTRRQCIHPLQHLVLRYRRGERA